MRIAVTFLALALSAAACGTTEPSAGTGPQAPEPAGDLLVGDVRVFDGTGVETTVAALLDDVAEADAVFVGETHLDDATHRFELAVLEGLLERTGGRVVLSLEMFERDVQEVLDRYLAGEIDEAEFLATSRPWGNYRTGYRPLIEAARRAGIPVVAANFPAPLRFRIRGREEGWNALTDEQRRFVPRELHPNSAAYWERVDRATRGHGSSGRKRTPEERLYDGQCLWDNAMGEAVADAIARWPERVVLHVVGGFHVRDRDGTAAQCARRAPGADLRVVSVWPQLDLAEARPGPDLASSDPRDHVVLTAARATGLDEGRWAVEVGASLRYKIRVPDGARDDAPAPLLVWLCDDGARDDDGLAYWQTALGGDAAVVAVDPLHLSEEEDLSLGGRWYWTDTFDDDASAVQRGLARIVEYVTRRFPVDGSRVVVAGRGTGATAVLWTAMYTGGIEGTMIAAQPVRTGRLTLAGLPDGPSSIARLRGVTDTGGADAMRRLLADYVDVGIPTDVIVGDDPMAQTEAAVREALGLAPATAPPAEPVIVSPPHGGKTARRWAELYVLRARARGEALALGAPGTGRVLDVGGAFSVDDLRAPGVIPPAPGPFGGTTLLVVPAGADDAARAAWTALADADPLAHRSRFHRMVLAYEDGSPSVAEAIEELRQAGRKNVLVVPARFCATGEQMRAVRAAAGVSLRGMTIQFLPGLGARLGATAD